MCVQGCTTHPFGSLLSSATPAPLTSGRQDCTSSSGRRETGVTPSCCFLSSQAEFEPTVRPARGHALDSEDSSLHSACPLVSAAGKPLLSLHRRPRGEGSCCQGSHSWGWGAREWASADPHPSG